MVETHAEEIPLLTVGIINTLLSVTAQNPLAVGKRRRSHLDLGRTPKWINCFITSGISVQSLAEIPINDWRGLWFEIQCLSFKWRFDFHRL